MAKKKVVKKASTTEHPLVEKLAKLLRNKSSKSKVLTLLKPLAESDRVVVAKYCAKLLRTLKRNRWSDNKPSQPTIRELIEPTEIAAFCVCNFSDIKSFGRWNLPDDPTIVDILKWRKPDWIPQFVDWLLHTSYYWNSWPLVRELVKLKLCPKPDDQRYYTGMISGLCNNRFATGRNKSAYSILKQDSGLLKDEVWKLFEYEGEEDNTLANVDRWSATSWSGALIKFSKEGKLSRSKLLNASLSALELGFNHYRSHWFWSFFDALKPTEAEFKKLSGKLLGLISSPIQQTALWAFEHSKKLFEKGVIKDVSAFSDSMSTLLLAKQKSTPIKVLKALSELAQKNPHKANEICMISTDALAHEKVDVQKAAFKLITTFGSADDSNLHESVEANVTYLAASFRKPVESWLATAEKQTPFSKSETKSPSKPRKIDISSMDPRVSKCWRLPQLQNMLAKKKDPGKEIPAAVFRGDEYPRLSEDDKLSPIQNLEEWIEVASRVLEDDKLIDEGELVLGGLARLGQSLPDDFSTLIGPLFKRAKALVKRNLASLSGFSMSNDLCALICSWIHKTNVGFERIVDRHGNDQVRITGVLNQPLEEWINEFSSTKIFGLRVRHIAGRLYQGAQWNLLSTPTHRGGWIDPQTLVDRVNELTDAPDDSDVVLALLRLAPDNRKGLVKKLKTRLAGEWLDAIKHGLGAAKVKIGKSTHLWAAAARARCPFDEDKAVTQKFSRLGIGCGLPVKYKLKHSSYKHGKWTTYNIGAEPDTKKKLPKKQNPLIPTEVTEESGGVPFNAGTVDWLATLHPVNRTSFYAAGIGAMSNNLDWWEAEWQNRNVLLPLVNSDEPISEVALTLLLIGLGAKEPGEHGLAADIVINAILDGRIGSDSFGQILSDHIPAKLLNLTRLAKRFEDIGSQSILHAYVIFRSWELALASGFSEVPKGLGDILELLIEFCARYGFGLSEQKAIEYLNSLTGSNKSTKAARNLLEYDRDFDFSEVVTLALQSRLDRL